MNIDDTIKLVTHLSNVVANFTPDDALGYVGLQRRRTAMNYILPAAGLFGIGVAVGVGVGMALAPKKGAELRDDVRDGVKKTVDEVKEKVSTAVHANGLQHNRPMTSATSTLAGDPT